MSVLQGLRVIEVSGSGAASWAAKQLADWGAEVTIIEPPGGTPLRNQPPWYGHAGERRSAAWAWLSRGKQYVEAGSALLPDTGAALAAALATDVVLIESELSLPVLGLEPLQLEAAFAGRATCVLIAPFAADGPYGHYRAADLVINALGGWCNLIGDPGERPLRPGHGMIPRLEGVCAFVAALMALRSRAAGGSPAFVEVSGQAVAATMIVAPWLMKSMLGIEQNRRANDWLQGGVVECGDGWLGCTPLTATHWEMMCHILGLSSVLESPEGFDPNWRWAHSAELLERARPVLSSASKVELFERLQEWRIPAAPVENVAERLACPQLAARGYWSEQEIDGAVVRAPRVAYRIEPLAPVVRGAAAPRVAPLPSREPSGAGPPAGRQPAPFAGLRVLDLTHFWAGPYATALLGAAGADVIKIESIQHPDAFRYTFAPAQLEQWWERSPLWQDTNVNKRGLTLDLASDEGMCIFKRLAAGADVVIENFSNRVMANFGLTAEALHELNPRLICVSVPGYGPGGPWEDYVGFGLAFEQLAVCASITGYEGGVPRIMSGFADPLAGLHAVAAIALALTERERTGRGAAIEVSQCEVLDSLFAPEHIAVQKGEPVPGPRGNQHDWMAPHNTYQVAGDDRWIAIAVDSDEAFARLCTVLGRPELATDPRFATVDARKQHEAELDGRIAAAVAGHDGAALERSLQAHGVMAGRVAKGWELTGDANLAHLGFFQEVSRAITGTHPYKTWPFRVRGVDLRHKRPAPRLGEHTAEILAELAGIDSAGLDQLRQARVTGERPLGAA